MSGAMTAPDADAMLAASAAVHDAASVQTALYTMAAAIRRDLGESLPLVLPVMTGAVVFAGQLLPLLDFPLEIDYLHASRYRGELAGADIRWQHWCATPVAGRQVLVLDDILDEGLTLAAIRARLLAEGAASVRLAVFCEKQLSRSKPLAADYVGLSVPDRYVFGFGMDARGMWRNLPEIRAL